MSARKSIHLFVIALCLWLPLQAIAGQWLHCAQLQFSLNNTSLNGDINAIVNKALPPCHQAALSSQQQVDQDQQPLQASDINSCKHCQFVCHWHCVLLVDGLISSAADLTPYYIPFKNPSPAQPLLPQLHKPPKTAIV